MDAIIACTGGNCALVGIQSLFNVVEYIDTDVEYIDDDVEYVDTVVKYKLHGDFAGIVCVIMSFHIGLVLLSVCGDMKRASRTGKGREARVACQVCAMTA